MEEKQELENSKKNFENQIVEVVNDNVIILEEKKQLLDKRFGFINQQDFSVKYYFADKTGRRLSPSFYSIESLDDIHYVVSDLDFMYNLGFEQWADQYGNDFTKEDIEKFLFHYGVVAVNDTKVDLIVPTVYHDMKMTNNNVLFVFCDKRSKVHIDTNLNYYIETIDPKLGAINLDINSDQYGMNILPTICDSIVDFDLDYEGFAYATVGTTKGYLSKTIDTDRYQAFLKNYLSYMQNPDKRYSTYIKHMQEAAKLILYTEKEVKEFFIEKKGKTLQKKLENPKS